jgi:hypothetical protein
VEQLQLLDATERKAVAVAAVAVSATARSEVIDLMARILVAVIQTQGEESDDSSLVPSQSETRALVPQSGRLHKAIERQASAPEQGKSTPSV